MLMRIFILIASLYQLSRDRLINISDDYGRDVVGKAKRNASERNVCRKMLKIEED